MQQSTVIFWDFDETLGYRDGKWTQTVLDLLTNHGITDLTYNDISPRLQKIYPWGRHDRLHELYMEGLSWWEYMTNGIIDTLIALGLSKKLAHEIGTAVHEEYLRPDRWHLYDDAITVLKKAKNQGYRNMILSNHVPDLDRILEALHIAEFFEAVFTSGALGYEKPSREIFFHAIGQAGFPRRAVMVGDNFNADVTGALSVGMHAVLVRKENTFNYPAYAPTLSDVLPLIRKMT